MTRIGQLALLVLIALPASAQERVELRLGLLANLGSRNTLVVDQLASSTGMLGGAELMARWRSIGVRARVSGGSFTDDGGAPQRDVAVGDVTFLLGAPRFTLEGGAGLRAVAGALSTTILSVARVGIGSQLAIGSTGVSPRISVGASFGSGTSKAKVSGFDLETSLFWFPTRLPAYVVLGYRHEQFLVTQAGAERPEELGSVVLGAGFRLTR